MLDLATLNEPQRQAVTAPEGPVLVLAGAGSGKTRVLTYRIAWLIHERGIYPSEIAAVTFTNKAAGEMAERVSKLIQRDASGLTVSTFHALGARILRSHADALGLGRDFVIYDDSDTLTLLKRVMKELGISPDKVSPRSYRRLIDQAKNELNGPEEAEDTLMAAARFPDVYRRYQEQLKASNAVDFGDLLRLVVELFETRPDILGSYRRRLRYLHIDEYQDTNHAQYRLTRLLAEPPAGLFPTGPFVVGDEDQSIYAFRGADIRNILDFNRDYAEATVVRLEQNYRSTGRILKAANAVVEHNSGRLGKALWSAQGDGELIRYLECGSEAEEASRIAEEAHRLRSKGFAWSDMAVFYRANSLSRPLEEALGARRVPYQLIGQGFYDRKEIKDARAWLQLIANPLDLVSLERIINEPPRGIGAGALAALYQVMSDEGLGPVEALARIHREPGLVGRAGPPLARFYELLRGFGLQAAELTPRALLTHVLTESGYLARLEGSGLVEDESRVQNLQELSNVAAEFDAAPGMAGLRMFLERVSLRSGADDVDTGEGRLTMMTLHMAKGLEFPVVFLVGMEDGIFPNSRAREEGSIEEERRLCYVGMTRAMRRLYISRARRRRFQGQVQQTQASQFIKEIPPDLMKGQGGQVDMGDILQRYGRGGVRYGSGGEWTPPSPRSRPVSRAWGDEPPRAPAGGLVEDDGPFRDLQVGRNVSHPTLGDGRIIRREGPVDNPRLTIRFRDYGEKKIMARAGHLELVFSS